jgi:hypothetical protein
VSALWAGLIGTQPDPGLPRSAGTTASQARLRSVPAAPARLARRPFAIVLIALFGIGMTGLLMLNTTLQNQAFQSTSLNRQATQLAHVQVDLQTQLDALSAAPALAQRASDLGMRANPKPAFLVVPSGKVIGQQYQVKGNEMPNLIPKTDNQLRSEDAADAARRARIGANKATAARAAALQAELRAIDQAAAAAQAQKGATAQTKQQPGGQQPAGQQPGGQQTGGQQTGGQQTTPQQNTGGGTH